MRAGPICVGPEGSRIPPDSGGPPQDGAGRPTVREATHMDESRPKRWVRPAVVLGIGYALVGVLFALPTVHARSWRLAAWVVCALGYAAQILYERVRLQHSPGLAALHVAFAAALGAFGLAVGANIHSLCVGSPNQQRQLLLLSLGIWPMITALPAFLVALGAGALLARAFGTAQPAAGERSPGLIRPSDHGG
jgi:hypothetical protein